MDLFKTEMLRTHPPQRRSYGVRRPRPGCRSIPSGPMLQSLAAAIHLALPPHGLPQIAPTAVQEAPAEAA